VCCGRVKRDGQPALSRGLAARRLPYFAAAMSRNQRIGLVLAALVVAVLAFVIAQPGDDDGDSGSRSAQTTPQETENSPAQETDDSAGTEPGKATEAEPSPPPEPEATRIRIQAGTVAGGPRYIEVTKGDTVRIVVQADTADEIHLHGYDITRNAAPGHPARFSFEANLEGAFEIESHVAEDAGKEPLVARLVVQPS
jgi:FtsP/CotA-like multicopper oxidase with cupredoxin domain